MLASNPASILNHVWTARWVQVVKAEFGIGSNAVMCPAFDAAV